MINQNYPQNYETEYSEIIKEKYYKKIISAGIYSLVGVSLGVIALGTGTFLSESLPENKEMIDYLVLGGGSLIILSLIGGMIAITKLEKKEAKEIQDLEGTVSS